jgi:hypothetical protein
MERHSSKSNAITDMTSQPNEGEGQSEFQGQRLGEVPQGEIEPAAVIQALLHNFAAKLASDEGRGVVPSIPELIKLFQFLDEIEQNAPPTEIEVRWIDWDGKDSKL